MEWLSVLRGVVLVVAPIGFFYQRDLPFTYLVSVDNTTWFIAYWLFLPMAIWYAIEKFEGDSPSSVSSKLTGNIESFKSSSTKKAEREVAVQKEREFIKEEVAKSKANDSKLSHQKQYAIENVTWEVEASDKYSGLKPDSRWYFKTKIDRQSFEAYMFINNREFKELEHGNSVSVVLDYEEWLGTDEGKKWKRTSKLEKSNPPVKETIKVTEETKEDKLKKLKDLYEKELISKEVYEKQQLEILSE